MAIFFLPFFNIYSDEIAKSITYITIFEALPDSEQSIQIEDTIQSAIKTRLQDQGLSSKLLNRKWSAIKTQSLEESGFIFIGFYQKKNGKSNLNIYFQIIDSETNETVDPLFRFQYPKNRPDSIDPWIHASSKFAYYFTEKISLGISVFNMINKDQYLLKNNLYPFDYRRERRRFLLDFSATF